MHFGLELIIAFIFLFPIIALLRNYQILKSPLYLEFSFMLFLTFVNFILLYNLNNVKSEIKIVFQIMINFTAMLILFIFYNIFWKSSDKQIILQKRLIIILAILCFLPFQIIVILNYSDKISENVYISRFLFQEFYRFIVGYGLFRLFKDIDLINNTRRTYLVKQIFLSGTLILAFMGLIRFIGFTLIIINNQFFLNQESLEIITRLTISIGSLYIGFLLVGIAIFFPEALILTKTQLILVEKLYKFETKFTKDHLLNIQSAALRTYLTEISDIIQEMQPQDKMENK